MLPLTGDQVTLQQSQIGKEGQRAAIFNTEYCQYKKKKLCDSTLRIVYMCVLNENHRSESLRPWFCLTSFWRRVAEVLWRRWLEGSNPPDSVWSCRVQCETGRSGRRVWMIFGLGLVFDSSSSSVSLSQTWTTTLGVDSVPACSSNFSPVCVEEKNRSAWEILNLICNFVKLKQLCEYCSDFTVITMPLINWTS